jgi:hypothetical protein
MIDKSLRISSVFVSVVVKHYTRSEGINYESINIKHYVFVCLSVCIRSLVIRHANCRISRQHCVVMCGLSGCAIFLHIVSQTTPPWEQSY